MSDVAALRPDPSPRLEAVFRAVHAQRMRGLDFVNAALEVEAVGFAPWEGHWLGIVVTPWFMNLTLVARDPRAWQPLAIGAKRRAIASRQGSTTSWARGTTRWASIRSARCSRRCSGSPITRALGSPRSTPLRH